MENKSCLIQNSIEQQEIFEEVSLFQSGIEENGISGDCSCFDCDGNPG